MPTPQVNRGSLHTTSDLFSAMFESEKQRLYAYIYAFVLDKAAADDSFSGDKRYPLEGIRDF
ncbi:hypothetical protein [Alteromonas sp. KUL42]|uniref:hypothetical protein n=1 Tax=Alteromonas sp. KUL42 TaxID=2480797 RepID=UPI001F5E902D|nr:hypothetical protein [Alteromonas sp. KUL42]